MTNKLEAVSLNYITTVINELFINVKYLALSFSINAIWNYIPKYGIPFASSNAVWTFGAKREKGSGSHHPT